MTQPTPDTLDALIAFIQHDMQANPNYYLFRESEPVVTDADVAALSAMLGRQLPDVWVGFQKMLGGGCFRFLELLSLSPASDYYLLNHIYNDDMLHDFLPIASDGAGGYIGYAWADSDGGLYYYDTNLSTPTLTPTDWDFIAYVYRAGFGS